MIASTSALAQTGIDTEAHGRYVFPPALVNGRRRWPPHCTSTSGRAARWRLERLHGVVVNVTPGLGQGISYTMPCPTYRGVPVAAVVLRRNHVPEYPLPQRNRSSHELSATKISRLLALAESAVHRWPPAADHWSERLLDVRMRLIDERLRIRPRLIDVTLLIADASRIRVLTLDRPEALNAFSRRRSDAVTGRSTTPPGPGNRRCSDHRQQRAFSASRGPHRDAGPHHGSDFVPGAHGFPGLIDALARFPKPADLRGPTVSGWGSAPPSSIRRPGVHIRRRSAGVRSPASGGTGRRRPTFCPAIGPAERGWLLMSSGWVGRRRGAADGSDLEVVRA